MSPPWLHPMIPIRPASTAGYRAHLGRYPDQKVSVAVLCNVSTGVPTVSQRAAEYPTHVVLGQYLQPSAFRKNIEGVLVATNVVFWNVEKK